MEISRLYGAMDKVSDKISEIEGSNLTTVNFFYYLKKKF